MRRIDLWLIPWLCLLYLLSFLGKSPLPLSGVIFATDVSFQNTTLTQNRQIAQTSVTLVWLGSRPT